MGRFLVAAAFLALAWPGSASATRCDAPRPAAPAGLPAPVLVTTDCGTYAIDGDGQVVAAPSIHASPPFRIERRFGHLVLIEQGLVVWRSRRIFNHTLRELAWVSVGQR